MLKKSMIYLLFLTACAGPKMNKVHLAPGEKRADHEAYGKKYMIATQGRYATAAGAKMFALGGNAVDAATAISFVISVERPQSTGLGGGGFMLLRTAQDQKIQAIDFREKAPLKAHSKIFLDSKGEEIKRKSLDGVFAAGTPGLVAGVLEIQQKYGKLKLDQVLAPAIELARRGFKVYPHLHRAIKARANILKKFPAGRGIFFNKDGSALKEGQVLIQEDLAQTIERIVKKGRAGFYKGKTAKAIVSTFKKYHGLLRQKDLDLYNVKYRAPIYGTYKGLDIYSMPPPSSGGVHVIQILNTVEKDDLEKWGVHNPKSIHLVAASMQQAFADRARYLGDADFVKVPIKELTSKKYAQSIRLKIKNEKARSAQEVSPGKFNHYESDDTTHFTVADIEGNIISSTQTINGWFGSGVVVPGTGIVLNNEMDDFSTKVGAKNLFGAIGGKNNLVEAQKRPLSSMSPTIILKDARPLLALGTPSGTRILTCVAQTILNYIEYKLPLYDALAAVRFHHQWQPDELRVETRGLPQNVAKILQHYGYKIHYKDLGCKVQAVSYEGGKLHGVSDPRGQGMSLGK